MATRLAGLVSRSDGQALEAGRPGVDYRPKSNWRVSYNGTLVEATVRVH